MRQLFLADGSSISHRLTSSLRRTWGNSRWFPSSEEHLGIINIHCSSLVFFLPLKKGCSFFFFIFIHPLFLICCFHTIFGRFCCFKMAGRTQVSTPTGRFICDLRGGHKDCGNTIQRPLGLFCVRFVCVFVRECACVFQWTFVK